MERVSTRGIGRRAESEDPAEEPAESETKRVGDAVEFGHLGEMDERLKREFADGPDDREGHGEQNGGGRDEEEKLSSAGNDGSKSGDKKCGERNLAERDDEGGDQFNVRAGDKSDG
jgi:hypothetical protein